MNLRISFLCALMLPAAAAGASLEDLSWMAGDWRSGADGESFQEVWLEPVNGFMTGISRLYANGQIVMNEHLVIAEDGDDVVYRLTKHLRDDSGALEEREAIVMRVIEAQGQYVLFENIDPTPEEPRLLAYERDGRGMTVTVTDPPGAVTERIGGSPEAELVFELRLATGR